MIGKGTAHNNGAKLAHYLITGKDGEIAQLYELRGFASDDIREAFRSVHVMADATRATQPFFHVQVRTPDGENLTREQWTRVADRIEAKLRLTGQPRAIAFHRTEESGHEHMHIAWSRIDDETMTARPLPFFKLRLKEACRELEIELGLTRVSSARRGLCMAPLRSEQEQARRLGIDIHETRATIRACWERADSGPSFAAALKAKGLILARGERRDYIVLDKAGGMHALGKRVLGQTAAEVRARLAGMEKRALPTVEQARAALGLRDRSGVIHELTLAAAIEERDPGALLESITWNRATFTARDLDWAVGKKIEDKAERKSFVAAILQHPDIVRLGGDGAPRSVRYTTKAVLESEQKILAAAHELVAPDRFEVGLRLRSGVLNSARYENITREQVAAIRHATGPEALALIDGQAGTGKSLVAGAIREAYEAKGCKIVGLAPTNSVAQDLKENGFARARTLHSELLAFEKNKSLWDRRTVVILDEAAMVDTRNLAKLTERAGNTGAKLILIGDDRQLASIERGGMFAVLKAHCGAAELSEVWRQHAAEDRRASRSMASGEFKEALKSYDKKGAIHWHETQSEAAEALVRQWAHDTAADPNKSRFVFAYTNYEVDDLNRALREIRQQRGEFGKDFRFQTKHGALDFAENDRIQFTGTDRTKGIYNGQAGTVERIEGSKIIVGLDGQRKRSVEFDAAEFEDFRHGYAGTIFKGQGRTIDQTYLFHSEYWRASASYVALTRHREKTELFVSRDTAEDLKELTWQIARQDDRRAASHFLDPAEQGRTRGERFAERLRAQREEGRRRDRSTIER